MARQRGDRRQQSTVPPARKRRSVRDRLRLYGHIHGIRSDSPIPVRPPRRPEHRSLLPLPGDTGHRVDTRRPVGVWHVRRSDRRRWGGRRRHSAEHETLGSRNSPWEPDSPDPRSGAGLRACSAGSRPRRRNRRSPLLSPAANRRRGMRRPRPARRTDRRSTEEAGGSRRKRREGLPFGYC